MNHEEAVLVASSLLETRKAKLSQARYVEEQINFLSKEHNLRIDWDQNKVVEE